MKRCYSLLPNYTALAVLVGMEWKRPVENLGVGGGGGGTKHSGHDASSIRPVGFWYSLCLPDSSQCNRIFQPTPFSTIQLQTQFGQSAWHPTV